MIPGKPLILRRGALPYRGFLEGRTRDGQYLLLLPLSNLELTEEQEGVTSGQEVGRQLTKSGKRGGPIASRASQDR